MIKPGPAEFVFFNDHAIQSAKATVDPQINKYGSGFSSLSNDIMYFLSKTGESWLNRIPVTVYGQTDEPGMLHVKTGSMTYSGQISDARELQLIFTLLGLNYGSYINHWSKGGFLFLFSDETEQAKRKIYLDQINDNRFIKYYFWSPGNRIELGFLTGVPLTRIDVGANPDEENELKELFLKYMVDTIEPSLKMRFLAPAEPSHHTLIQECFDICERRRDLLFDSLVQLGWNLPRLNNQVVNTRYKYWNDETGEWNLHQVDAVLDRN